MLGKLLLLFFYYFLKRKLFFFNFLGHVCYSCGFVGFF